MKKLKFFLEFPVILLAMLMVSGPVAAEVSFLVAPWKLNLDMSRPVTSTLILTNTGDEDVRLLVKPVFIPIDDKSIQHGKYLNGDVVGREDMSSMLLVSPRAVSLKPGERRDVRVRIKSPAGTDDGDYRAHVLVSSDKAQSSGVNVDAEGSGQMSIVLNVKLETAVAIYGRLGEGDAVLESSCIPSGGLKVVNKTPWMFDGVIDTGKEKRLVVFQNSTYEVLEKSQEYVIRDGSGAVMHTAYCK